MDRLCSLNPKLYRFKQIYDRVIHGNLFVLRRMPRSMLTTAMVDHAVYNGHLAVLEWCCYMKVYPSIHGVKFAAVQGHLRILEYMYNRGLHLSDYPEIVDDVAVNGHADILRFLYTSDPELECSEQAVQEAESRGHESVVQFLLEVRRRHASVKSEICLPT